MTAPSPALRVLGLRKRYGTRDVVRDLELEAHRGAVTAVLGPNGAGKTTTIECCEGLRRPDAGHIEVLGLDRASPRAAAPLRRTVGVMLQEGGLPLAPPARSVLRHVARLHDRPELADPLLERLGLAEVVGTRVRRLSGGQRQRLALACAIVGEPQLVFLDEPTAGLDPQSRLAVWDLLRELREGGTSLVLTTHLMSEAEELADHVVIVDHGRAIAAGTPTALRGSPRVRVIPPPGTTATGLATALRDAPTAAGLDVHDDGGHVVITAAGPDSRTGTSTLAIVAGALATAGHETAEVALTRPTLEDTFLSLTGRQMRVGDAA